MSVDTGCNMTVKAANAWVAFGARTGSALEVGTPTTSLEL